MNPILIVDDSAEIRELLSEFLMQAGYHCRAYQQFDPSELNEFREAKLILLDLNMPGKDGLDVLHDLSLAQVKVPIVLCSGVADDIVESSIDILNDYGLVFGGRLAKPFTYETFFKVICDALGKEGAPVQTKRSESSVELTRGDLDISIKNDWFYNVYQPQLDIRTGELFSLECLSRLQHPLFGPCTPDQFIPKLVEFGQIERFTFNQLRRAIPLYQSCAELKLKRLSINIDPSIFTRTFLDQFEDEVACAGLLASQICLEITELSAVELSREVKSLMAKARMRGFNVSLDDFGTGFSTIRELDLLPFNEIKIDRSFVSTMSERKASQSIIKHTLSLAQDLDLLVVAEGVETEQQSEMLAAFGCQYVQGFLYARPMDEVTLQQYLRDSSNHTETKA